MKPNASILTFITVSEDSEQVIFMYCKQVEDIYNRQEPHWYNQRGEKGESQWLWEEKKLRQWIVAGKDESIDAMWEEMLRKKKIEYDFGKKKILFTLNGEIKIQEKSPDNIYAISGISSCGRNGGSIKYEIPNFKSNIPFLIGEENNCAFIEGYKKHDKIKPVFPPGLFGQGFLSEQINKDVVAVKEPRDFYWTLSGDRKHLTKDKDPTKLFGFIQASKEFREQHRVFIKDLEGKSDLGEGTIDANTGKWEVELLHPAGKGQFLLKKIADGNIYCGEKYYLVNNIDIKMHLVHTTIIDLFGRQFQLSDQEENINILSDILLWEENAAPDNIQAQIELSDKIASVIQALGKNIIFNDPYLFGILNKKNGLLKLNDSQKIFFNALFIAIAKCGIEKIHLVGHWQSAKQSFDKKDKKPESQEAFCENYKSLFILFKENFKYNRQLFKVKDFKITFSEGRFHDRYWIGINEDKPHRAYHISNSVSGIFETGELLIVNLEEKIIDKIQSKISVRIKNGNTLDVAS